jgi:flagellum-specific peptidoglycan hydrolase FlgJ
MSAFHEKSYSVKERTESRNPGRQQSNGVSNHRRSLPAILGLEQMIQRLLKGLGKLLTALRFQLYRLNPSATYSWKLPWFKLGLAALAFFILSQKNVQFSFNIKAPFSAFSDKEEHAQEEQMGIAQSIAFRQNEGAKELAPAIAERSEEYIRRFSKVAKAEHDKYGIPASLKMAQALLESQAGVLTEKQGDNNHFGAPMAGQNYESAWANWRAHSIYIAQNHPSLFQNGADVEGWAKGIAELGYSNNKQYTDQLLYLIDRFELKQLDR